MTKLKAKSLLIKISKNP